MESERGKKTVTIDTPKPSGAGWRGKKGILKKRKIIKTKYFTIDINIDLQMRYPASHSRTWSSASWSGRPSSANCRSGGKLDQVRFVDQVRLELRIRLG